MRRVFRAVSWLRAATVVACALSSLLAVSPAQSGSLSVTPIRVELSSAMRSVALTVRNEGNTPSLVQAQLMAWSQADNEDKLDPTTDLIASPPIFTVPAGGSQVLRIALRRAPDANAERTYRVLVTEVPGKPEPGFTGAQFALKISLPIFVEAETSKPAPKVEWSAKRMPSGDIAVTAVNRGARHVQLHAIELVGEQSVVDAAFGSMVYVLPGQQRTVTATPAEGRKPGAGKFRLRAESDAGPIAADVVVEPK